MVCGIDVSKLTLDVAVRLSEGRYRQACFSNDAVGFSQLLEFCDDVECFVMEATGSYHKALLRFLREAGFPAVALNPYRSRSLARGHGVLGKEDALDARTLAETSAVSRLKATPVRTPLHEEAFELSRRIGQLKTDLAKEKTRLKEPRLSQAVENSIRRKIQWLESEAETLEQEWKELIQKDEWLLARYRLALSVPSIGPVTARILVSELPTHLDNIKKAAGLAGVTPRKKQSGTSINAPARISNACNRKLKAALYMPAIQAIRRNAELKEFYHRLIAKGKHPSQAIVAVMRKIFIRVLAVIHRQQPWKT